MLKHILFFIFSYVFLTAPLATFADDSACKEDAKKLCSEAKGKKAMKECLQNHKSQLSEGCKSQAIVLKAKLVEATKTCKADAEKYCSEEEGFDKTKKCLKAHTKDLSTLCKAEIGGLKGLLK